MSDDKFEGAARSAGSKLEDAVGGLTGDKGMQMQGKLDQAAGIAQQMLGDAKQTVASVAGEAKATASDLGRDAYEKTAAAAQNVGGQLRENPVTMMIAAGVLGLVVGYLLGRPPHERAIQVGRARLSYRD